MTDSTKTTVTRFRVISNPNPPAKGVVVGREITRTHETSTRAPVEDPKFVTGSPGHYHAQAMEAAPSIPHRHKFGVVPIGTDEERAAATGSRPAVVGAAALSVVRLSEKDENAARALAEQIVKNHAALSKTPSSMAHQPMVVSFYEPDSATIYNRAVEILALEYDCHVANYARIGHGTSQVQVDPRFHHDPDYSDVGC